MGYSRSEETVRKLTHAMTGIYFENLTIVDEGYEYKDDAPNDYIPFPCNPFYDAKAFGWVCRHIHQLQEPIIFWNIGA